MSTARLAVRDALAAWVASTASLVAHTNLDYAIESENLPCAAVQSGSDAPRELAGGTLSGAQWGMEANFDVVILVANSADPEAAADVFEALLMASLKTDATIGGSALLVTYKGGEWAFDLGDCTARRLMFEAIFVS